MSSPDTKKIAGQMREALEKEQARGWCSLPADVVLAFIAKLDPVPTMGIEEAIEVLRGEADRLANLERRGELTPEGVGIFNACRSIVAHYEAQPKAEARYPDHAGVGGVSAPGTPRWDGPERERERQVPGCLCAFAGWNRSTSQDCPIHGTPAPTRTGELVTVTEHTRHNLRMVLDCLAGVGGGKTGVLYEWFEKWLAAVVVRP